MVNLQRAQYEEIRKVVETSTKFKGLSEVVASLANDIKELKLSVETIQAHVISHTIWQIETDKELALLPQIRDNQELLMFHVDNLIKSLNGDDAKKDEGVSLSIMSQLRRHRPTPPRGPSQSKYGYWFDVSKTIVEDPYADFAMMSKEAFMEKTIVEDP